jgi:uncharacterized protein (TIGR02569 family)
MLPPDSPPSDSTLRAFGVSGFSARRIDGGQGITFRAGLLALKRCPEEEAQSVEWLAGTLEHVEEDGFRIARPVRSASGSFLVDRWSATRWIDGTTAIDGRWPEAMSACVAFHRALRHVPWSPTFENLDNPYSNIDAELWSATPTIDPRVGPIGERLGHQLRPVNLSCQLVHGDPSEGNLLFLPGSPVGIIDIAPYWHPPDYALAVMLADGIACSGAPVALLDTVRELPEMDQLLARAVLFRLLAGYQLGGEARAARRAVLYTPVAETIERWQSR